MPRIATIFTILLLFVQGPLWAATPPVCTGVSEAPSTTLAGVRVASGLIRPLFVDAPPGDVARVFVLEQDGRVRLIKNGALLPTSFLDISALTRSPADTGGGDEEGLLGLAFHPDYTTNGWFFLFHTNTTGSENVVARYTRSTADPDLADPNSRAQVIAIPHPGFRNHNGGMVAFGPDDGYLYIGSGDGGSFCDPNNNAQNGLSNLGKLLRIDVDGLPYSNPPDNPFLASQDPLGLVNDEIWALGLRNPWRFSFAGSGAPAPSDLYIADVGQGTWEEIDYRAGGGSGGENYGWDKYEGTACPNPSCGSADCNVTNHVPPILEYDHSAGACSVTGGYVYHGCRMPDLHGTYFYGDFCAAFVRTFRVVGGSPVSPGDRTSELDPPGPQGILDITSFGRDARGEVYVVDRGLTDGQGGEVWKIEPDLSAMEVSDVGADPFRLDPSAWAWEDLTLTSAHGIDRYRVYRSAGAPGAPFDCVLEVSATEWIDGDPAVPAPGGIFHYLVTALDAQGGQTSPGAGSTGVMRTLSGAACPS